MDIPGNFLYTKDHFWIKREGNEVLVGLTDYGQSDMGEILFVDLPELEDQLNATEAFGIVESDIVVADLVAPVSGEVVDVNFDVADSPEVVNEDPYGDGWIVRIHLDDTDQLDSLMTADEYQDYISDLSEGED